MDPSILAVNHQIRLVDRHKELILDIYHCYYMYTPNIQTKITFWSYLKLKYIVLFSYIVICIILFLYIFITYCVQKFFIISVINYQYRLNFRKKIYFNLHLRLLARIRENNSIQVNKKNKKKNEQKTVLIRTFSFSVFEVNKFSRARANFFGIWIFMGFLCIKLRQIFGSENPTVISGNPSGDWFRNAGITRGSLVTSLLVYHSAILVIRTEYWTI